VIAESLQRTIANMRTALERDNGDYLALAPRFLEALEGDAERVEGLERAAVCEDAAQECREVTHG